MREGRKSSPGKDSPDEFLEQLPELKCEEWVKR